jgi:hypothetical protein
MKKQIIRSLLLLLVLFAVAHVFSGHHAALSFLILPLFAHCDTMDGPVVQAARAALETGDVNRVLIWVRKNDEDRIRKAFDQARRVRALSPDAREMADMYFFETLVRIHRAGEGAAYTGIKPAGSEADPGVALADKAVEAGSADEAAAQLSAVTARAIREKFAAVKEAKKHMNESVDAGRKYVAAYIGFIHYVAGIHRAVTARPSAEENGGDGHIE